MAQLRTMVEASRGEEGRFFLDKLVEMAGIISAMPKTYEQDGKGDQAVAYLHYFGPVGDYWITEKDMGDSQVQAFGLAKLYEVVLGCVSIRDAVAHGMELDLHFAPKTLGEIRASFEAGPTGP